MLKVAESPTLSCSVYVVWISPQLRYKRMWGAFRAAGPLMALPLSRESELWAQGAKRLGRGPGGVGTQVSNCKVGVRGWQGAGGVACLSLPFRNRAGIRGKRRPSSRAEGLCPQLHHWRQETAGPGLGTPREQALLAALGPDGQPSHPHPGWLKA